LTAASIEVGQGNLDYQIAIESRDEVGILAKTFQQMIQQIKKLLRETAEKVRMEQELITASWVQESLFPHIRRFEMGSFRFAADHMSSSECSGDWWHYFHRGEDLFIIIGDATGHGTSAALVTAASRAVFSHLETTECSLEEMAMSWNRAIIKGSSQKLFMTAQLLQINSRTGHYRMINLSHELPFRLTNNMNLDVEPLSVLAPLGRNLDIQLKVDEGSLDAGAMLLLYTDGLFAIENVDGKKMNERTFLRRMSKIQLSDFNAEDVLGGIFSIVKEFRSGESLLDDIAILVIERKT
jgi:sigma-B regulation protein RsbU (phosphoserine phosphatase)